MRRHADGRSPGRRPDEISGTERADAIRGLGGNDRLSGSSGDDDVYGGGSDKIRGNYGDDRLMADDGRYDEVWCGSGTDYVYADVKDAVYYGCETVQRQPSRYPGAPTVSPRLLDCAPD